MHRQFPNPDSQGQFELCHIKMHVKLEVIKVDSGQPAPAPMPLLFTRF